MKLSVRLAALFCMGGPVGLRAQLVAYNPDSPALSGVTASFAATSTNANVSATDIIRGSGLTGTSAAGGFSSSSWNEGSTFATAASNNNYYTFTVTPAANYTLSFTNITANVLSSGTGSTNAQWANGSTALGSASGTITTTGSTGTTVSAALSDSGVTTPTEFHLVAWGASATGGTTKIEQTATLSGSATLRSAGILVWDGGQGNGNWNSYSSSAATSNWNANNLPTSSLVDSLQFAGSSQTTTNNNISGLTVGSVTFNSGTSAFTVGGNALTLNSDVTNSSSNTQTIDLGVTLGSGSHSLDAAGGNISISGVLTGAGSIVKTGSNTLILTGANAYTGGTTVNNGTLSVTGSGTLGNAAGAVSIGAGGTLSVGSGVTVGNAINVTGTLTGADSTSILGGTVSGSGTLGGALKITGTLAPGNSPGIITVASGGSLTFGPASFYSWDVASLTNPMAGVDYDQIKLLSSSSLDATGATLVPVFAAGLAPNQGNSFWNSSHSFAIIDNSAGATITGTFAATNSWGNGTFSLTGTSLDWAPTAIPEPATFAACLGALALAGAIWRRRQKAA